MRAKKSLGQNFLVDANAQRRIVEALDAGPANEVLEIGPGRGALTDHLAGRVGRLVLVELDDALAARFGTRYADDPTIEVVHQDVLRVALADVLRDPARARIVGNIPYNITTPIIFHLLDARPRPERIVLMVQREVADRLMAEPGGKTYGALTVGVRSVADVERVLHVKRGSFRPVPDVDSTVVMLRPHAPARLTPEEESDLRVLTRETFGRRRKQLGTTLRSAPAYALSTSDVARLEERTGIEMTRRPETLQPDEFIGLARALREAGAAGHLPRDA